MAIDRGPFNALVDDDGSNLVGSVWNKAAIESVILTPVDAAIAAIPPSVPVYGTWTPIDVSGAGLVFAYAAGTYTRIDRLVFIWFQVVYPSTSDGALASIGGLPVGVEQPGAAGCNGYGPIRSWHVDADADAVRPLNPTTGMRETNAQVSGVNAIVAAVYLTL